MFCFFSVVSFNIPQLLEGNPASGIKSPACPQGEPSFVDKLKGIQDEARYEGIKKSFYPTAADLLAYAVERMSEEYFGPCESSPHVAGQEEVSTQCTHRRFAMKKSNPQTIIHSIESSKDWYCVAKGQSPSSCPSPTARLEQAELSFQWARWKTQEHRLNAAFVYSFTQPHYAGLLGSKDEFGVLRNRQQLESTEDSVTSRFGAATAVRNFVDISILLGYLQRRFEYSGRYLRIGCSGSSEKNIYVSIRDQNSVEEQIPSFSDFVCVEDTGDSSTNSPIAVLRREAEQILNSTSPHLNLFDLIYIDGIHESENVFMQFSAAIDLLAQDGTLIVSNAR